jgi:hypothetical protein
VPTSVGVNAGEAAAPPLNVTAPPTGLPPGEQPLPFGAVVNGPQTEKFTAPVGIGPPVLPVTMAWSVFDSPSARVEEPGVVEVLELAAVTVKHSVLLPSEDGA